MLTEPYENPLSGRTVKCPQCGKELFFAAGEQTMICPFCGHDFDGTDAEPPKVEAPQEEYRPFSTYQERAIEENRPETAVGRRIGRLEFLVKCILGLGFLIALMRFLAPNGGHVHVRLGSFAGFFQLPLGEELAILFVCGLLALCFFSLFCLFIPLFVKRFHDLNLSGWWVLLGIIIHNVLKDVGHEGLIDVWEWIEVPVFLFLAIWPGDKEANRFGKPAELPGTFPGSWGLVVRSPLVTKIFWWTSAIIFLLSLVQH